MKVYSPIKAGGGSILGKPENQLSQIISIHPDVAAESGDKLLIADGSYYNAYDRQVSELKNIYGIEELNNLGTESSVLTLNTGDIGSSSVSDRLLNTAFFENLSGDKYIVAGTYDPTFRTDIPSSQKWSVYRMLSNETVFTLHKVIDFGENFPNKFNNEYNYATPFQNYFFFNPETSEILIFYFDENYVRREEINLENNNTFPFSTGIITLPPEYNYQYLQILDDAFVGSYDYKKDELIFQALARYNSSINFEKATFKITGLEIEKLGIFKAYSSLDDLNNNTSITTQGLKNQFGYAFKDNEDNIFYVAEGTNYTNKIQYSYSKNIAGLSNNDLANTNYDALTGNGNRFFNKNGYSFAGFSQCRLHPTEGYELGANIFTGIVFDKNLKAKVVMAYNETTIANELNFVDSNYNKNIPEQYSYISEEDKLCINFTNYTRNDNKLNINAYIIPDIKEAEFNNYIRTLSIIFDNGETITDGTNTFELKSNMVIKHLTGNKYIISSYLANDSKDYAIVELYNNLPWFNINPNDPGTFGFDKAIRVVKIVKGKSNIQQSKVAQFHYNFHNNGGSFSYYFNNYQDTGTGVDGSVDLMFSEDQLGERVLIPDRTAYNDPNGLSKDYIIKSVKGIKDTTTGE